MDFKLAKSNLNCLTNIYLLIITDKVLATLGEGTFGKVVKVKDLQM